MEQHIIEKRETSGFVPYRRTESGYEFYLQMREKHIQNNPGVFGMFGGGLEGKENAEEALYREIKEELSYTPKNPLYFTRYEIARAVIHVFLEEVDQDFESKVIIGEGEYGKFLTPEEIYCSKDVTLSTQVAIHEIVQYFSGRN